MALTRSRIPAVQTRLVAWRMRPRVTRLLTGSRRPRRRELVRWRTLWARGTTCPRGFCLGCMRSTPSRRHACTPTSCHH